MTTIAIPRRLERVAQRPDVSWLAVRVWERNRDVFLNIWKAEAIWPFIEPLLTLVALGFGLGDFIELDRKESYIEFIGPGILAAYAMWMASAEGCWGGYFRIDQKTFDAMLATPVSIDDVTSGEVLWASTRSLISVSAIFLVVLVFGAIDSVLALLILPLALLPGVMFGAISLSYAAIAKSVSSLNYFFAVFITPQFWLAGAFFPLDELPGWVNVLAWFTPAFHVVELYRGLTTGHPEWIDLAHVAWILAVSAVFYALAIVLMRRRLVK
ncbi:MAG TPA: ABC transporter permease [Dehalococcoidia bacterium]|nr:ABC transporter permease [Dehalococcoidia bacterium]